MLRPVEVNSFYQRRTVERPADVLSEPDVGEFNFLDFIAHRELGTAQLRGRADRVGEAIEHG